MSSAPLHESPPPEELLSWFVNHMRSLGEEDAVDNHASPYATDKDTPANQESSSSVTE